MAHEGLTLFMVLLGVILLVSFYFGPKTETRQVKRQEGMVMLVPSAALLFILAIIVFSGIIG